jgi:hypothetical protein
MIRVRWTQRFLGVTIAYTTAASVEDRRSTEGLFSGREGYERVRRVEAAPLAASRSSTHLARVRQ